MITTGRPSANPGYDVTKDFAPIGTIASIPIVVMANASVPVKTLSDVIALAKKEPGKVTIGSPPPPTLNYFGAEQFKAMTGIDVSIVTYKGTGPLTNDLVGGHVMLAFNTLPPAIGNIQAGKLNAIAVCAPSGSPPSPTCRPRPRPACRGSTSCSTTGSPRPPARRGRSSSGSTRSCAPL
jgi:tripartite-type tricarboxylate transporter receptor subunit TctC